MIRILLSFFFIFYPLGLLHAQTLDYLRDVFFDRAPFLVVKDYYYQYSPLLSVVQGYNGKGLKVLLIHRAENSPIIAKRNIDLEADAENGTPYLFELMVVTQQDKFSVEEFTPDIIILEESLYSKYEIQLRNYKNKLMLFNDDMIHSLKAKKHEGVRDWWLFDYKLDGISKELIRVWRAKEKYRDQILLMERSKNLILNLYKRVGFIIFFLGLFIVIFSGYYFRMKRRGYRIIYLFILIPAVSIVVATLVMGYFQYERYYTQVKEYRNNKSLDVRVLVKNLAEKEPLNICIVLRSLIERIKDHPESLEFVRNTDLLVNTIQPLNIHFDERVRMLSVDFLGRLNTTDYSKYICDKDWNKEESYLVRSRVVRTLRRIETKASEQALLELKKTEKHPYVFYELRDVCIERGIWVQQEAEK